MSGSGPIGRVVVGPAAGKVTVMPSAALRSAERPALRTVWVLAALALAAFVLVTTETLPIGLLPLIADGLHASPSEVGLLVTLYGGVVVLLSVPATHLTRRVPRRTLLAVLLVMFSIATGLSAAAPTYLALVLARLFAAVAHAVFWSIAAPAAASLLRPEQRGRATAFIYTGGSLAAVVGIPLGTWAGYQLGWRAVFAATAALGAVSAVVVAALMRTVAPGSSHADRGTRPDLGRFAVLVATTVLATTGAFTMFTFIGPYLTSVAGLPADATGAVLLARGVAGVLAILAVGALVDRVPWALMLVIVGVQAAALLAQWAFASSPAAVLVALTASGATLAAVSVLAGARVLRIAPGSTSLATSMTSTAFNVGITGGALIGSAIELHLDTRTTALAAAGISLAALLVTALEPRLASDRRAPLAAHSSGAAAADRA